MTLKKTTGPKKLNTLFERYKQILQAPEQSVIDCAVVVIEELMGITLKSSQLRYSPATKTLHITNGMIKAAVIPHKQEILAHLTGRLGVRSAPKDIC